MNGITFSCNFRFIKRLSWRAFYSPVNRAIAVPVHKLAFAPLHRGSCRADCEAILVGEDPITTVADRKDEHVITTIDKFGIRCGDA